MQKNHESQKRSITFFFIIIYYYYCFCNQEADARSQHRATSSFPTRFFFYFFFLCVCLCASELFLFQSRSLLLYGHRSLQLLCSLTSVLLSFLSKAEESRPILKRKKNERNGVFDLFVCKFQFKCKSAALQAVFFFFFFCITSTQ